MNWRFAASPLLPPRIWAWATRWPCWGATKRPHLLQAGAGTSAQTAGGRVCRRICAGAHGKTEGSRNPLSPGAGAASGLCRRVGESRQPAARAGARGLRRGRLAAGRRAAPGPDLGLGQSGDSGARTRPPRRGRGASAQGLCSQSGAGGDAGGLVPVSRRREATWPARGSGCAGLWRASRRMRKP